MMLKSRIPEPVIGFSVRLIVYGLAYIVESTERLIV